MSTLLAGLLVLGGVAMGVPASAGAHPDHHKCPNVEPPGTGFSCAALSLRVGGYYSILISYNGTPRGRISLETTAAGRRWIKVCDSNRRDTIRPAVRLDIGCGQRPYEYTYWPDDVGCQNYPVSYAVERFRAVLRIRPGMSVSHGTVWHEARRDW